MKKKLSWKNIWRRIKNIPEITGFDFEDINYNLGLDTWIYNPNTFLNGGMNSYYHSKDQRTIVQGIICEYAIVNWKQVWKNFDSHKFNVSSNNPKKIKPTEYTYSNLLKIRHLFEKIVEKNIK
jgi:hypothetical protein